VHELQRALDPLEGLADVQRPDLKVDVCPAEPERLAPAKSDGDGDRPQGVEPIPAPC
jgi:hypothetical protein